MNAVNLTNGLEYIGAFGIEPDLFVRLQSSHLEGGHWQRFVDEVDNGLLWHLSQGEKVYLCDCGSRSRNGVPRTIWQGIPIIRACCERAWHLEFHPVMVKGMNVSRWWAELKLDLRKYRYFRKHLQTDEVRFVGRSFRSTMDGRRVA